MMTKEEAIKNLKMQRDLLKFNPTTGEEEPWRYPDEIEALDMAIGALEGSKAFLTVSFDRDEMQRSVDNAAKNIRKCIIEVIADDLNEIHEKLWSLKISAPNIIENREHYKQIQDATAVVEEKLKKWQEEESEE